MNTLKNILAVIGLASVLLCAGLITKYFHVFEQLQQFDPQAGDLFADIANQTLAENSAAAAMVVKVPVKEGLSAQDVDQAVLLIANELNIKNVGELFLYKEVEAVSGTPFRYIKTYLLCSAMTAASMVNYNDAFAAYLPCRITLLEDKDGKLWLYTQNMDILIYGGRPLPPALKAEEIKVRDGILEIMRRAARNDF
jgi:hypothetical protein